MVSEPSVNVVFHVMQVSSILLATFNCCWQDQSSKMRKKRSHFGITNRGAKLKRYVPIVLLEVAFLHVLI
jgi:hypothetical protein